MNKENFAFEQQKLCFWTKKSLDFKNLPETKEKVLYRKEKTLQNMRKKKLEKKTSVPKRKSTFKLILAFEGRKLCFWTKKSLDFKNLPETKEKVLYRKEKTLQNMRKKTCKEDFCT